MKGWWLALFSLCLLAQECPSIEGTCEIEPPILPFGCVNVATGRYCKHSIDHITRSLEPLALHRRDIWSEIDLFKSNAYGVGHLYANCRLVDDRMVYRDWTLYDPEFGKLRWAHERTAKKDALNGLQLGKGVCNLSYGTISGRTNPKNITFRWNGTDFVVTDGGFTERHYRPLQKDFGDPEGPLGDFHLAKIAYPNGNIIHHERGNGNFVTALAKNSAGETLGGYIKSVSGDWKHQVWRIDTSDNKTIAYQQVSRDMRYFDQVCLPGGYIEEHIHASKENNFTFSINRPEGRGLKVAYYVQGDNWIGNHRIHLHYDDPRTGRVIRLMAPDSQGIFRPLANYSYGFHRDGNRFVDEYHTRILDAAGGQYFYDFDSNHLITQIRRGSISSQKLEWGEGKDERNLISKKQLDHRGRVVLQRFFTYDSHGNVLREILAGRGEHYTKNYTYSPYNQLLTESDGRITTRYTYLGKSDLITSKMILHENQLCEEWRYNYDASAALTQVRWRCGDQERITKFHREGSQLATCISEWDGAGNLICATLYSYDQHNRPIEESVVGSDGEIAYTIQRKYTDRDLIAAESDPEGHWTYYTYDANDNLIEKRGPLSTHRYTYDFGDRCIAEECDGLTKRRTFDLMGRLQVEYDESGEKREYFYDAFGRCIEERASPIHSAIPIIRRTFDSLDRCISETNPMGERTEQIYTMRGQIASITYPDGTIARSFYSPDGQLIEEIDPTGISTRYVRDWANQVIRKSIYSPSDELLREEHWTYDGHLLTSHTDPEGITTHYEYNSFGQLIAERCLDRVTSYTYDPLGRQASVQVGETITTYTYDKCDRLLSERTAGRQTLYEYDAEGHCTLIQRGEARTYTSYDANGRPTLIINPEGHETHISYTPLTTTTTDPLGRQTIERRDSNGLLLSTEKLNTLGQTLFYQEHTYDLAGNLIESRIPSNEITTQYIRGPMGRLQTLIESEIRTTHFTYDTYGRLITTTQPSGDKIERTYDALGRLATLAHYSFAYDKCDRLLSDGTFERSYTPHGELATETLPAGTLTSSYDNQGRRTCLTLPDGSKIHYEYNALDLCAVQRNGQTHRYTYNDRGLPTQETLFNGHEVLTTYDLLDRPTQGEITYDSVGNLISTSDKTFTYDELNQLASEPNQTYQHDSVGNRTSHNDTPRIYNALNQPTDLPFDPNGNLLSYNDQTLSYDALNRLEGHTYDSLGRRLSTDQTHYIWDGMHELGTEFTLRILGLTLHGDIGATIAIEIDYETYCPLHDHRGSIIALLDESGFTISTYEYTAFGICTATDPLDNPWRFCSKRQDPTGLVLFGHRYYAPDLGRWTSPDPAGYEQGPNLYTYCSNRPLTHKDLYGLRIEEENDAYGARPRGWRSIRSGLEQSNKTYGRAIEWVSVNLFIDPIWREKGSRLGCFLQGKDFSRDLIEPSLTVQWLWPYRDGENIVYSTNGIRTSKTSHQNTVKDLSNLYDANVCMLHVDVPGIALDIQRAVHAYLGGTDSFASALVDTIVRTNIEIQPGEQTLRGHSHGGQRAVQAANALPSEILANINIITENSPTQAKKTLGKSSINIRAINDPVSLAGDLKSFISRRDVNRDFCEGGSHIPFINHSCNSDPVQRGRRRHAASI